MTGSDKQFASDHPWSAAVCRSKALVVAELLLLLLLQLQLQMQLQL